MPVSIIMSTNVHRPPFWSTGMFCSIYYLVLILAVGIPMWLKTTSPTLYSLPDVKNLMVHSQMIAHKVHITVVTTDENVMNEDERKSLRKQLTSNFQKTVSSDGSFSYILEWKVRPMVSEEIDSFKKSESLRDVDQKLGEMGSRDTNGRLWIYLLHDDSLLKGQSLVVGHYRMAYLRHQDSEDKSLAENILDTVQYMIEPDQPIINSLEENEETRAVKKFLIDPEIEVYVNFIFEKPEDGVKFPKSKTFKSIIDLVDHFISKSGVRQLLDINVSTQIVHYAIDTDLLSSLSTGTSRRLINIKSIPTLLNAIESRIVEPNNRQSYNLHVIIPGSESPETLFVDGSNPSPLLSSVSRGDFLILNNSTILDLKNQNLNLTGSFNVPFKMLMRKLVGVDSINPKNGVRADVFFHGWELDHVMRKVAQKQILKTLSSLESVQKLVSKITNIVIQKDVAEKMNSAVEMSHQALNDLASGNLGSAFTLSTKSYQVSERAFFDPSLLELLYFPHDQKFAVYLPLFLPVSLPLLSSLYHIVLFILRNRK